ncbi:MAG: O-acetyl-ADP-ribose deacetylase [Bifidobacteriaceae bacterium]|jgi:O-acetyl-ADP-ribose deacetylase (regulator of RNase III)|nr:O-acetyl-ADP-ribose deacetylase [Bifidobacteriaceae bacterium]
MRIELVRGDITRERVDGIVNAANSSRLGGGGVDGAIHSAAGPALLAECRALRRTTLPQGLPVGQAVATGGGDLHARWVIYTVGPNRHAGQTDPALLRSRFTECLRVADQVGARTVAFPAISADAYGWSPQAVARQAREALAAARTEVKLVRFALFSALVLAAFQAEFSRKPLLGIPQHVRSGAPPTSASS